MLRKTLPALLLLHFSVLVPSVFCQTAVGTVSGIVKLNDGDSTPSANRNMSSVRVALREMSTSRNVQDARVDSNGRFMLHNVPFAAYRLEAWR